jgi:hypothetical protein
MFLLLAVLATCSDGRVWWKKLTYIMMMAIYNLHVGYGHCAVKQIYKNVQNNFVKVTNGL